MATAAHSDPPEKAVAPSLDSRLKSVFPIGRQTRAAWREAALTRAAELGAIAAWARTATDEPEQEAEALAAGIRGHLEAARVAAERGGTRRNTWVYDKDALQERIVASLDSAESELLRLAPQKWLRGQVPTLRARAASCLAQDDPRRQSLEEIARQVAGRGLEPHERDALIAAAQAVSSERRHEIEQVRYLRNTLALVLYLLTVAAVTFLVIGLTHPAVLPLCFSDGGNVACPTSQFVVPSAAEGTDTPSKSESLAAADDVARHAANVWDIALVEMLGVMAAALSAGIALRGFRRRRSPYDFPRLLALIKLPTGALTAVLGLLLIRAQFIPGLSALDSATQIVAWAVVLGYAQQIFTRLIDQRAQTVLNAFERTSESGAGDHSPPAVRHGSDGDD